MKLFCGSSVVTRHCKACPFRRISSCRAVPVASAWHYIVGGSYETAGYLFDVEAYAKDLSGVTEYTLRFAPQIGRGLVPQETFFNGTGTVRGVDDGVDDDRGR